MSRIKALKWTRHALHYPNRPHSGGLAALNPKIILPMLGSAYSGDGATAIRDMAAMMEEILGSG